MTINIADNSPRISYTVAEGATQTSFAVPFEFFDNGDLNVYVDGTLKTITTHYTVSGGDGSTGTVTISVTGATGGSTVVVTRDIALERTTDFPVSGAFNIVALNTELDRLVAVAADLEDQSNRALQLTDFDAAVSLVLPDVDTRKGKTLAFNASTGAVEAGPSISDTQTVSAASADIATLADTQDGTTGTNSITTLASNVANVITVGGISSNVTTVAGIASDISTVAADGTDIGTVATNIASVNTVATNIADVITVANDLAEAVSEVETVANDLNEAVSEIDTVAGSISNVDAVGGSITNVNTVATGIANINTVAGISSNVTTVAGDTTHIQALGPISSDITTVSGISSNVSTVAGISSSVPTVASVSADVSTVAGISANVTTVAGISANVSTVASNVSSIQNFADVYRIGSSDPTSSLDTGDLFYNTSSSQMKVYNGSAWEAGVLSGSGTLLTANNLSDLNSASTAITNLGITASAAELNFVDGVTSNIQTQIDAISPDPTLGTLTKSFANGETSVITLSSTVSPTAIVAVTKEVSQTGASSKGGWDVASDASNYELYNQAPATSLSLSSASADGTATLGTGSFASADVGKRIFTSDGGEAVLTATDGSYSLSSAFGATTYTSGNWSLSGLDVDATNGITLSGAIIGAWDISAASSNSALSTLHSGFTSRRAYGLYFKPDGLKFYYCHPDGDAVDEWDLTTAWDITTGSFLQSFSVSSQDTSPLGLTFKPDGTKMYVVGANGDDINEYALSTAWDVSTASYTQNFSVSSQDTQPWGVFFKTDGTKMYVNGNVNDNINEYNLSTAWDISSASYSQNFSFTTQTTNVYQLYIKSDGLSLFITGRIGTTGTDYGVFEYSLSTAWDVSTMSYVRFYNTYSETAASSGGIFFKPDGKKMFVGRTAASAQLIEYTLAANAQPTAQYLPALTSTGGQIDSQFWTDINSMTADDVDNDGQVYYAVSTDDRTTWSVNKASDGVRPIVRNNSGTWQYNSNATYGSTTYTNGTTNDEFATIAQAMTVAANQMDKAQVDAVADGSHFTLGNTLDLAIIPYLASNGTAPTSDGVSINYDAAALNKGAILGTDYDYDLPATNKVRITSNAAQNLKVRIV
ncbi:MAG: putative tail fiber protein [Prokaryotic dsDNA virus sp.]|nr:MAG: putative tail fiber protein [Prokaryotic dsDNA virus sp.]|tara:strand:+ start:15207 stop:18524 length:3318 start_codon:yes stop_codon:yes gene_type:complete